ncbi:MAG: nucleotide sugar dehydrogenase [Anaerococcus sp.]|uniref:nucleotide sugar dehydrogenase n=1 Tax=Anaerococcus sp. TaxID=1872515 RepID=UPI0028FE048C|nr:nucleotide sugar dehydrogenase [Anaerococcus sp.]MDU2354182.1 nucleotide sugar dehydrogenase [Anaerococcus sp.]
MYSYLYSNLKERKEKVSVIGLGYVGLPLAVALARKYDVVGFDINEHKINLYKNGEDPTNEVGDGVLSKSELNFTSNPSDLKKSKFHIVAVPTPINQDKTPNLTPVVEASKLLGKNLTKGSIVVYESTVYPGVTEDVCRPILEEYSGLECGKDFKIGYSPERINPGDKNNRLENIVKIVSGMDEESLEIIYEVYNSIIDAGVHKAPTIKVAEAAKVIENSQRDINIAFMNEISIIFDKMGIDTKSVLEAASTKWNFLSFYPGLVGGHCIGVDPYYLTYAANQYGYKSEVILSGRNINDSMGTYIADKLVKALIGEKKDLNTAKVGILGFTFKEDCPDTRNTKVYDIVNELNEFGVNPIIVDPEADREETKEIYNIELENFDKLNELDALIVAVSHKQFKELKKEDISSLFKEGKKILFDLKGIYDIAKYESDDNYAYWRL